jgi:hypothetical protein
VTFEERRGHYDVLMESSWYLDGWYIGYVGVILLRNRKVHEIVDAACDESLVCLQVPRTSRQRHRTHTVRIMPLYRLRLAFLWYLNMPVVYLSYFLIHHIIWGAERFLVKTPEDFSDSPPSPINPPRCAASQHPRSPLCSREP